MHIYIYIYMYINIFTYYVRSSQLGSVALQQFCLARWIVAEKDLKKRSRGSGMAMTAPPAAEVHIMASGKAVQESPWKGEGSPKNMKPQLD